MRVPELPAAERDRNLESLRFIAEQATLRGLDFQLGIWTHGYVWINSPHPNYTIAGITAANHGAYSRDALRLLLQQVPSIITQSDSCIAFHTCGSISPTPGA